MDVLGVMATTEQTADDLVTRNLLEDLRCFVWREDTLSSSLGGQNLITLIINHGLMGYDTIILQWIYLVSKKTTVIPINDLSRTPCDHGDWVMFV